MPGAAKFALCCLLAASASGCSIQPVKAWERGDLARPEMALTPDPGLADHRRHTEFSKEAAAVGYGLGGGGCGCN